MRIHIRTSIVILMTVLAALPIGAIEAGREATARKALEAVFARNWETFSAMADARMNQVLTAEAFASIPRALEQQYGTLQRIGDATIVKRDGLELYTFDVALDTADLGMLVVLDAEGKVSGLRIVKVDARQPWTPPDYADPSRFHEEEVTVGAVGYPLKGTLAIPTAEGRVPAVVLVHGSGPHDRDETIFGNKPFRDLAWGLASKGTAVLRYEKRTQVYGAKMDAATVTLEAETIDDAVAAVLFLRARKEIDPDRIFVLGHSLGGLAAPYIAERDKRIAGIISLAGSARPILDVLVDQLETLDTGGQDSETSKKEVARIRELTVLSRSDGKLGDEKILGVPLAYWRDLDRRDPAGVAAKLPTPILVIQGGRDYQVTMKDFEVWKKALAGKTSATLKIFDDLNHLMMSGTGRSTPEEYRKAGHVALEVVEAIATQIVDVGRKK